MQPASGKPWPRPGARTNLVLLVLAWGVWAATAAFRFFVVFGPVNPRHRLYSDAMFYVSSAFRFGQGPGNQTGMDAVWGPGTASLYALTARLDGSLTLTALALTLTSAALPLVVADTARTFGGRRAFALALALASLHPLYLQYATVFVSDLPFAFLAALTLATTARVFRAEGIPRLLLAGAAGAWAAAAFLVRGPALSVGLVALVAALPFVRLRALKRGLLPIGVALLVAVVLVVPSVRRCRELNRGHFCPASVNGPMNVALGHAGTQLGLVFEADERGGGSNWVPPSLIGIHHYQGIGVVPASIFNTPGVLAWVGNRLRQDPKGFLGDSLRNVGDLFTRYVWLNGDEADAGPHAMALAHQVFLWAVVVPGWALAVLRLVPFLRRRSSPETWVLVLPLLGVVVTAALTLGESRYRMPFDGCAVVLVALALARFRFVPQPVPLPRPRLRGAVAALVVPAVLVLAVAFVSDPATRLGPPPVFARGPLLPPRHRIDAPWLRNADKDDGYSWFGPGVLRLRCVVFCDEAVVHLPTPVRAGAVAIGVDVNDTYSVELVAGSRTVGRALVGPREPAPGAQGLRRREVPFVLDPGDAPVDTIRVAPLFGDGFYAVGYVTVRETAAIAR